eukprot:TRINITY_DN2661_c0_g5_i1.p1 TRINITY_DN2661_c0_g5~~TRINITY_DN2661_c0_g5_i1.p1  ORF type:complete len:494 (+),score=155.37 TRINITY_DN2661_c0_g5_i1:86-1567(+)
MNQSYDVIILGTGMVECVLAGVLAVEGRKVLHIDRNNYYGGDCASLRLDSLYEEFDKGTPPASFGKGHLYNVDLAPKLLMGAGNLVKILSKSVAERYSMSFLVIEGSYVLHRGKIYKVPITPAEALGTSLMGILEKRRCASFLKYVAEYDEAEPKTYDKKDLKRMTFQELRKSFGLDENTEAMLGTCVALELDTEYLRRPAIETVKKLQLYLDSQMRFSSSPYVYPMYGLGDIPQAFSRLCAVFGGEFMLNQPQVKVHLDDAQKFEAVSIDGEKATAPIVIGDPTYFPSKVKKVGEVVRAICILDHPIAGIKKDANSCQIILPAKDTGRRTDSYIVQVSSVHQVVPRGFFLAIVSATMEAGTPEENVAPGLKLLGTVLEKFVKVYPQYTPDSATNTAGDGCFITNTLDATSHFETAGDDFLALYERITGKRFDTESWKLPSEEELMEMAMARARAAAPPADDGAAAAAAAAAPEEAPAKDAAPEADPSAAPKE